MIATIATWLIGNGVSARLAKPLVIGAGIALMLAVLSIGKCAYDRSIIEEHDAKQAAKVATAARTASETATAKSDSRNAQEALRRAEIAKDVEHAKQDPNSNAPAGPASRAFIERVRRQQAGSGEAAR